MPANISVAHGKLLKSLTLSVKTEWHYLTSAEHCKRDAKGRLNAARARLAKAGQVMAETREEYEYAKRLQDRGPVYLHLFLQASDIWVGAAEEFLHLEKLANLEANSVPKWELECDERRSKISAALRAIENIRARY